MLRIISEAEYSNGPYSFCNFRVSHGQTNRNTYFMASSAIPTMAASCSTRRTGTLRFGRIQ